MSDIELVAATLIILTQEGVPADVQELLVYGNPARGIRPGALLRALKVGQMLAEICEPPTV